jgi:hypothetical protein
MHSHILSGIIADLRVLIDQIDNNFKTLKELLLEVARRLDEDGQCETSQICTKIKEILKDKIEEGKISEKWIANPFFRSNLQYWARTSRISFVV